MTKFNWEFVAFLAMIVYVLMALMAMALSAGCVTAAKNVYKDITATPIPTPTPSPTPRPIIPTPIPTPAGLPTLAMRNVDPFVHGERWQGQWFKWLRTDVQGEKELYAGIIVYRSEFVDQLTYYNNLWGQYYQEKPAAGNRYFVVWVHEEMFGENGTYDPSMWIFDEADFRLQINGTMQRNVWPVIPEYQIGEFQNKYDYYDTVIAAPFGYDRVYTSHNPETGGWIAQKRGWLRMGKGNAIDGYMIYEVSDRTMPEDVILLGNFATFGNAYWRFTT